MPFILPFEREIVALDEQLAALDESERAYAETRARLEAAERELYPNLSAHDTFLISGHPLRPKALDYVKHIFYDVHLFSDPEVKGDHLLIAGQAKIDLAGKPQDVVVIGQQTGPSSQREDLLTLPVAEYRRWNQGMGFPDSYRKAVYFMERAEQHGWPVLVFVDTPGADPSEYSEEEGQAFAINDVIHKTTSLKVPNLSYIISLGASGGAIAITPTNRTIMNQYATYMVISPGGCASILFRNRSPESIRNAAVGLQLTSADALRQGTVDEVVEEGLHPGHRYPDELLERARDAVARNLIEILKLGPGEAEPVRRAKFFAMGVWGESDETRGPDALAELAVKQEDTLTAIKEQLAEYLAQETGKDVPPNGGPVTDEALHAQAEGRLRVAQLIYAVQHRDASYVSDMLDVDAGVLSKNQWAQLGDYLLERRYGNLAGADALHPNGGVHPYRRQHPVDWIRRLADRGTFREFAKTLRYCSVDQLNFPEYADALERGIQSTGLASGLITGTAKVGQYPAVLALNNFGLVGSSLCDEIGEKFRHAAHQALETGTPLVSVAMGGGARMQEGTPSMHRNIPKAQHALNELEEAGVPHISVIADPTLGGTAISYGLRGDHMIVVKHSAHIGFSGKRVVEQFQQRKVAADFQHATWLLHRGFVDERVATENLRDRLIELLRHLADGGNLKELRTRKERPWRPVEEVVLNPSPSRSTGSKSSSQSKPRKALSA